MNINKNTEYLKIYEYFYDKFLKQTKLTLTRDEKINAIDAIMDSLSWNDSNVLRLYIRYYYTIKKSNIEPYTIFGVASKMSGIPENKLRKLFDIATRHMYAPDFIVTAVPTYYKYSKDLVEVPALLIKEDFGNKKYIVTALNKQGFMYNYELKRHLSNGWYYLWTIPGIGDAARQQILITINKWEEEGKW